MKNGQFIGELIGSDDGNNWSLETTTTGKQYAKTIIVVKPANEYDKPLRLKIIKWPPFKESAQPDWDKIIGEFTIGQKVLAVGVFRNTSKFDNLEFVVKEMTVL